MTTVVGNKRLYSTLCTVLDALCAEAPPNETVYHPPVGNTEALIQARSRALLHLFLKARFGLTTFQARDPFVTDGSFDGGIDAYYIDKQGKQTYLLQSKFRATADNFANASMTAGDLIKMDVKRILRGETCHENRVPYNNRIKNGLQRALRNLPDAGNYDTNVVLLGNAHRLSPGQLKKLVEGYSVDQYPHSRAYKDLLFPVINGTYFTDPNLTIEIDVTNVAGGTHLDYSAKTAALKPNVKLLFVPTREIGRVMSTYKNSVLKYNPRSFLELTKNKVNQEIEASILHKASNEFAPYNNGITIIADNARISTDTATRGRGQVVLRNPQLVNGGQTAYTLGRIYEDRAQNKDFEVFKGKDVLLKIIIFGPLPKSSKAAEHLKLIGEISKASNSQTKVGEPDRRSNDPIQLKLQEVFFERHGLYYERKLGEFSDGLHYNYLSPSLLVRRDKLVRVGLACDYKANQARSSLKKFFTEAGLPSLLKIHDAEKYAYGYEVLGLLEKRQRAKARVKGDRYHIRESGQALRYGQYAVVAVCANVGHSGAKSAVEAVELVLSQWRLFEKWAQGRPANSTYRTDRAFSWVNYYKGATINSDLERYKFKV